MLGENFPVASPTNEDSGMTLEEQSDNLSQNQNPIQPDPSAEILPCVKSLQQPSTTTEDVAGGDHSGESSDSSSDAVSESGPCFDSGSHSESVSGSVASLGDSPITPSKETLSETPKDQTNMEKISPQVSDRNEPQGDKHVLDNQKTESTSRKCSMDMSQATRFKTRPPRTLRDFSQKELISI